MSAKEEFKPTKCPDAQSLAAFIEGKLDQRQRSEILLHIRACHECRELVANVITLRRDLPAEVFETDLYSQLPGPLTLLPDHTKPIQIKNFGMLKGPAFSLPFAAVFMFGALLSRAAD